MTYVLNFSTLLAAAFAAACIPASAAQAQERNVRLGSASSGVGFIDAECGRTVIGYEVPAPGHSSGSLGRGGSVAGLESVPSFGELFAGIVQTIAPYIGP